MNTASVYLATQVVASTPVERVVLLYRGAIRYAAAHLVALDRHDRPAAHTASIRAQEIVGALRESLDMTAGPVARQLDGLYDFCLRRLMEGNVRMDPVPTRDALTVLTGLLEAWTQLAGSEPSATTATAPVPASIAPVRPPAAPTYGIVR